MCADGEGRSRHYDGARVGLMVTANINASVCCSLAKV